MNVLKYDYDECKKMLDARRSGQDSEAFYSEIADRYPRALKWKDTPYPHMELLRIVFEENGDGLEPMPELNEPILHLPVETPASRKRGRESLGGLSNYKVRLPFATCLKVLRL
ncbi:hypothetical protein EON64_15145 [archaeon]|nr:MAG: hypothetical protein EON64_15145 [archaeon]